MRSIRMGKGSAVLLAAVACLFLAGNVLAAGPFGDPAKVPVPPLGQIQVPTPERYVMDNGMVVYLLEDHEFPLVDARALVRAGSIYDPTDKVGLASVTGTVMRSGGTKSISGDDLDEKLESMGASVEVDLGQTQGTASMSVLSKDTPVGISLLADVLRNPAFPQDKIDLAKKQEKTDIAGRNDEPLNILMREFPKLIYGREHPYSRNTEYATIDAISRDDLVKYHQDFFHPDRIILTVYGDFDPAKVKQLLQDSFGDWAKASAPVPPDPQVNPNPVTGMFVINKEGMTNSMVVLGQIGIKMDDPDYPALDVYNEVLGGGSFSSRLVNDIRTKRGLAYAAGSSVGAGLHHPGGMVFYAITQTDSTVVTLGLVKDELERSLAEPFTAGEVQRAKDQILNALVFDLSSKRSVLNRLAQYEYYGYPADFLQKYQSAVKQITPAEVLAAAKRHVKYPEMGTLIIGEKKNFADALGSVGPYQDIDITIPEPAAELPEATDADFQRGQALMSQAAKAMGASALTKVKDMTVDESGSISIQGMEIQIGSTTVKKLPDCERMEQKTPMGQVVTAICGDSGWMQSPRGVQDIPGPALAEQKSENERDLLTFLTSYPDMKIQSLPDPEPVDGKPADVLFVHSDAVKQWKVYLDKDTHRIVRMDYRTRNPMTGSPAMAQETLSDYRTVSGFQWPHKRVVLQDGDPFATVTVNSVKVNTGVQDSVFKKPS